MKMSKFLVVITMALITNLSFGANLEDATVKIKVKKTHGKVKKTKNDMHAVQKDDHVTKNDSQQVAKDLHQIRK